MSKRTTPDSLLSELSLRSLEKMIEEWKGKAEKEPRTWAPSSVLAFRVMQMVELQEKRTKRLYFEKGARWALGLSNDRDIELRLDEEKMRL